MLIPFAITARIWTFLYSALVIFVCFFFFYGFTEWFSDWRLVHQSISLTKAIQTDEPEDLLISIPGYHLFGHSVSNEHLPITNLQLTVTGIVKLDAKSGAISKAYISSAGGPSKIFKVNDMVSDGVKIYDITPDAVILDTGGHLEKLPLPRKLLEFKQKNGEPHG